MSANILPSSAEVLPSSANILPSSAKTFPPSENVFPSSAGVLPCPVDTLPLFAGLVPSPTRGLHRYFIRVVSNISTEVTSSVFVYTRKILDSFDLNCEASALPLEDWLDVPLDERPFFAIDSQRILIDRALWPVEKLCDDLYKWGIARQKIPSQAIKYAVLIDCLTIDPTIDHDLREELHWAIFRSGGSCIPWAACRIAQLPDHRWTLLGLGGAQSVIRDLSGQFESEAHDCGVSLPDELEKTLNSRLERLQMAAFAGMQSLPNASQTIREAMDRAISMGKKSLNFDNRCESSWEINRSGFLGYDELIGDLFNPLIVLEAAHHAGMNVEKPVAEVLESRLGKDIRYYRDCPEIPFDSDDAAQVLIILKLFPKLSNRFESLADQARQVLRSAINPDGSINTWTALPNHPQPEEPDSFFGQTCPGVQGRALKAICTDGQVVDPPDINRIAEKLSDFAREDGSYEGVYYPSRIITTSLAISGLQAFLKFQDNDSCRKTAEKACQWLVSQQTQKGALGRSVLETLYALSCLDKFDQSSPEITYDSIVFFCSNQKWDGAWPACPFVLTAHPNETIKSFSISSIPSCLAVERMLSISRKFDRFLEAYEVLQGS